MAAWVMDIIFHTMVIAGKWVYNIWHQRSVEVLLGASFVMQLGLSSLAGYRWHGASKALQRFIWLLYIGANYLATTALGILSIRVWSSDRQLVAFWVPFFLLHLGGPDNITAYEFEDNQLSIRSKMELVAKIVGALISLYNSFSGGRALILATLSMLFVGVIKYWERTFALYRADLGNMARSLKLNRGRHHRRNPTFAVGDDDALLMKAHSFFHHICKHAMVESLVVEELDEDEADKIRRELWSLKWFQLFKVMEFELSLMYEFLYTKASVIYTWHGYGIRVLSPLAALGSLVLVELSISHGGHSQSDVVITHVLLVFTFILEMVSLLRALGSSWTGFLICTRMRPAWIHHQFFCNNGWHRFRRAIASIGLLAKFVKDHQVSDLHEEEYRVKHHRRWSGNIGQLNLFQQVTCGPLEKERGSSFWAGRSQEQIKLDAKKVLYRKVRHKLADFILEDMGADKKVELAAKLRTKRGQNTLKAYGLFHKLHDSLGTELQEGILTWHIGTNIFLNISDEANKPNDVVAHQVEAVRTLSDYMLYLLSERPHMLPGLVTRQLLEQTRRYLVDIWNNPEHAAMKLSERGIISRQENLAKILRDGDFDSGRINRYLDEGINLAKILINKDKQVFIKEEDKEKKGIVEVILEVWVDMLYYASYRCSKESHAKQLADGGELTTIVWLLAEHFILLVVPRTRNKQAGK